MAKSYKTVATSQTDDEIIAQCRDGNKPVYRLLVDRYKDAIYATVLRYTHEQSSAEEITQETFVKAWKALHKFEGRSKFSTWLMTIAINKAKDVLKEKQRIVSIEDTDAVTGTAFKESHTMDSPGPEQMVLNDELAMQLKRLIGELPDIYREAFVLRHVDLLSYDEISGISKISVEAVKMRVFRAREILKEKLYQEEQNG